MTETTSVSHPLSLQDVHLPLPPDFWPLAWGWWSVLAAIVVTILLILLSWQWRKRRLRAKKAAIALLRLEQRHITPSGAMEIVRQAVLSYYPRVRVAHLSGADWLIFLDSQVKTPIFKNHEQQWLAALYKKGAIENREELIAQCNTWLTNALPPRRGGRG